MEKHPLHLKNPELQTSREVNRAVKRKQERSGEKVPNDPAERIEAYMARLADTFLNPDERIRKRNLEYFRPKIHDALIVKRENFPESYFELQKRIARERGQAVEEIPADVREQMMDTAIHDQEASLDAWMDYLTSDDAVYPPWFKYFVWRNVIKLSQFDKERGEFKKRGDSTVAPFPDIYREPLAQIADIYEKVKADNKNLKEPEIRDAFGKKFPTLYAELIQKSLEAQMEGKEEIRGQWMKYEQGREGDAERLFKSLEGKGTGWCTAGQATAEQQIERGDFYVYYSNDKEGNPIQPRLAVRMNGKRKIAEVRGILPSQGVESALQDVLEEKLMEFGEEAESYRKKSEDMRRLTELERRLQASEPFTKEDVKFLYEIDKPIEGFGYQRDPRINEILSNLNTKQCMSAYFGCTEDQVALIADEINENTKVYVGSLERDVFRKPLEHVEHIYTRFPRGKVRIDNMSMGEKTGRQLIAEMQAADIKLDIVTTDLLKAQSFNRARTKSSQQMKLVMLTPADFGYTDNVSTDEVYRRAQELGLELFPPDAAPHYRLQYREPTDNSFLRLAMKPIRGGNVGPGVVFMLYRDLGDHCLTTRNSYSGDYLSPISNIAFRLPHSES